VLARKYRPQRFEDLIGQEAMVRTLRNAFAAGRIPQAWMLTGVRGVGKTTTARILARALNFERADGSGGPTVELTDEGVHCRAIMESRHVDILEMDAASHTGIDDVKQILDGVRYAPTSARMKVYIIDEVHMLSEKAFNAFLKTLEEPPPHVKFVFATTEIRKVPVTILSRCQRFDLRRVEAGELVAHLAGICAKEGVEAEDEALATIARASEGSVRDSLSLLDQAIAHGAGRVSAATVRDMLGLADRDAVLDLFEAVMRGDAGAAFGRLRDLYAAGADPAVVIADLAETTHLVTRLKLVPQAAASDSALTEVERTRGAAFAGGLPMPALSRAWQILLKGLREVRDAPRPIAAAEMLIARLAYTATLPTPDEALKALAEGASGAAPAPAPGGGPGGGSGGGNGGGSSAMMMAAGRAGASPMAAPVAAPVATARPGPRIASLAEIVALAERERDITLKYALERDVRPVRIEPGRFEFEPAPGAAPDLAARIGKRLQDWTGERWMVSVAREGGAPTLHETGEAAKRERLVGVRAHPVVRAVLEGFPGAEIVAVHDLRETDDAPGEADAPPAPPPDEATDDDF
jgi:DNA polymerase-3 subunit gamma/tau